MASPLEQPVRCYEDIRQIVERVPGFLMQGQEEYLFNKVRSLPEGATILEIGSYLGRSTIAMGLAAVGSKRRIFCIDAWQKQDADPSDTSFFDSFQQNIERAGVDSAVTS